MRIFARYMALYADGLNQTPDLHFLAFLDSLGVSLLPGAGRASTTGLYPSRRTVRLIRPCRPTARLRQTLPPSSPSPLLAADESPEAPAPIMLATTRSITLTRANLAALYSLDPTSDRFADHTAGHTEGFTLFDDLDPVEHGIYLGHDELFDLAEEAEVALSFTLGAAPAGSRKPLDIRWEYFSEDGWLPLEIANDDTSQLITDGELRLTKSCGPVTRKKRRWRIGRAIGYVDCWQNPFPLKTHPRCRVACRPDSSKRWFYAYGPTGRSCLYRCEQARHEQYVLSFRQISSTVFHVLSGQRGGFQTQRSADIDCCGYFTHRAR